ncbi:MAG TPA: CDP-alcohol phosphatidyltransferase family protein [Polyangiaceae bacterium]|jgi:phosphatidylglycerophosphate synthase|nr:CDP-alcohol phosphatidyltransferase family protein [Polyangiaceae bacterium]
MASLVHRWVATREGFKPRDVEEPIDYWWHRPLASFVVTALEPTRISANQVTFASAGVSLLSGGVMALGAWFDRWWMGVGGLLLLLSIVLDCADGQLARVRGTSSAVGRILDGTMDAVAPLAVFHGMAFYLLSQGYGHAWVWPLGWATAISLIWHASQYDVSKNIYLHASRPDFSLGGNTLLTPEDMRAFQREFDERGERFNAFLMSVWVSWTKPQLKAMAPWLEPARSPQNEAERDVYRRIFRPEMRVLAWLGFGSHLFLLTIAALLAPRFPIAIWIAWALMLAPMNLACLWVVITRRTRERLYLAELATLRSAT